MGPDLNRQKSMGQRPMRRTRLLRVNDGYPPNFHFDSTQLNSHLLKMLLWDSRQCLVKHEVEAGLISELGYAQNQPPQCE